MYRSYIVIKEAQRTLHEPENSENLQQAAKKVTLVRLMFP